MKPIFKAIMHSKCTTVEGIQTMCKFAVSLYPDMTYITTWCDGVSERGNLGNPKYGARTIFRLFEMRLQRIIDEHNESIEIMKVELIKGDT